VRLDQYLVECHALYSRNKARELIEAGHVRVNGTVVTKPSRKIDHDQVDIAEGPQYVSRAAWKLKGFLPDLPLDVSGMKALDIGASTGGFTQVLLEAGAEEVIALDVGTGQLHPLLREDPRVNVLENRDIRGYNPEEAFALVTSDVSFISLQHLLNDIDRVASCWIILLFKPQFEVGREVKRDRYGVIQDDAAIARARDTFEKAAQAKGWKQIACEEASIAGKEGNREYCYCFHKD